MLSTAAEPDAVSSDSRKSPHRTCGESGRRGEHLHAEGDGGKSPHRTSGAAPPAPLPDGPPSPERAPSDCSRRATVDTKRFSPHTSLTSNTCSGGPACPVRCVRPSCWICRSADQLSSRVMCRRGRTGPPSGGWIACSEMPVEAASEMTATVAALDWKRSRDRLRCAATSRRPESSTCHPSGDSVGIRGAFRGGVRVYQGVIRA